LNGHVFKTLKKSFSVALILRIFVSQLQSIPLFGWNQTGVVANAQKVPPIPQIAGGDSLAKFRWFEMFLHDILVKHFLDAI
jgi:hypothetical protein